jgi:hypothetical protein
MLRKSILFLSLASIAAMIAWGFAPGGSTPVCASSTSAQGPCALQVAVNNPTFQGTAAQPTGAAVSWTIANKPPCYRITGSEVTFTFQLNNGSVAQRVVNITGNGTNASLNLALAPLPANTRPNGVTANVLVRAVADPIKHDASSAFVAIP